MAARRFLAWSIAATVLAGGVAYVPVYGSLDAQDASADQDRPAPTTKVVPWSSSESPATPPLKELTTSGRVRLNRHVAVLFEGSDQMHASFFRSDGLRGHKGAEAKLQNALHLNTRTEALWFSFAVYRGGEGEPLQFGELIHGVKRQRLAAASEWIRQQAFVGTADLEPTLRRTLAEPPDSLVIVAGSVPHRPEACPMDTELGSWFVSQLSVWTGGRAVPPIHVLGIGLDGIAGAFFQRLASATGGTLTEVGRSLER